MAVYISGFDEVIAPLSREQFLTHYWNKSFVHVPGISGRFTSLLTWDDLNRILEQHRLTPPRFKLVQDGTHVDPDRYMVPDQPRPDLGKLVACLSQGATLVLGAIKEMVPAVQVLTRSFQNVLDADNFVNLYASWKTQNGFDIHWDAQDSIILQLSGCKYWRIYAPTRSFPLEKDVEKPVKPSGSPTWEGMLQDGDALYIPRGWWHLVHPTNIPSLHLTVSSTPPTEIDLLQWIVSRLRRHECIRRDLPARSDISGQQVYLKELGAILSDTLLENVIEEFRREPISSVLTHPHVRLPLSPYEQVAPLTPTTCIRLAPVQKLAFSNSKQLQMAESWSGGRHWSCPIALIPALGTLRDDEDSTFGELCAKLQGNAAVANLEACLRALAAAGIVLLQKS